ncbi:TPA: sugar O-acetyltransferase [Streptococcus suis]
MKGITMKEKDKCARGLLYDPLDEELSRDRDYCKDICFDYNQTRPSDLMTKQDRLRDLFGSTKGDFFIQGPFWCDYGYNIHIGKKFYANHDLVILDAGKVTFGDNVFIAPSCGFHTAGHPLETDLRNQGLEYAYPITVGNDVWIGAGVQVVPGVTIGNNVVIGAGSVVTKDLPDNVVAAGNPCRVIKNLQPKD